MWRFHRLFADTRGVSTVEYALLLVTILLAVSGGYRVLGKNVSAQAECAARFDGPCTGAKGDGNGGSGLGGPMGSWESAGTSESTAPLSWSGMPVTGPVPNGPEPATSSPSSFAPAGQPSAPPVEPFLRSEVSGPDLKHIDLDLAKLAENLAGGGPIADGWEKIAEENDPNTSFHAAKYRRIRDGAVAVVFDGSHEGMDWVTNAMNVAGFGGGQFQQAVQYARAAQYTHGENNVVLVGTSLGGALASTASLATKMPAVTYNSEFVHPKILKDLGMSPAAAREEAKKLIRAEYIPGEYLGRVQDAAGLPEPLGTRVALPDPVPYKSCFLCIERAINHAKEIHGMGPVKRAVEQQVNLLPSPAPPPAPRVPQHFP